MLVNIKHTYTTSYRSVAQPPGFADFVIGSMSLFCFNDAGLYVDYSTHPISKFLFNDYNATSCDLFNDGDIIELFNQSREKIQDVIDRATTPICVATNTRGYAISDEVRDFAIRSFKPKASLQVEIDKTIDDLNLSNFEVVHIRLGDGNMHCQISDSYKQSLEQTIKNNISEKDIFVISDNQYIKAYLREKIPAIKMLDNKPIHLGDLNNATDEDVKNTLLDFYIMSKSERITCYSIYGGSGFSEVCSAIYNIPYSVSFI